MLAVLGLSRAEFNALLCGFERCRKQIQQARPNRHRAPGGGRKTKLGGPKGLLFFILFYLKVYPTFDLLSVLADSGFQGARHPGLCLPSKWSKKHPLSVEQREWNGLFSSLRIGVEHAIGGMKGYAAAAQIYRNHLPRWDDHFNLLSAGLWNHHLEFQAAN